MAGIEGILAQRSNGRVDLRIEAHGMTRMREQGAAKVRFPHGSREAILINTGGGLAGGDEFHFDIAVGDDTRLAITTQALEKVYRTVGPPAVLVISLQAGTNAQLYWLPQETIFFDSSSLSRSFVVELAAGASLLAVEAAILGRTAMGESIHTMTLRDRWRIRLADKLVFADDVAIDGTPPRTIATLGDAGAMATVVLVSDRAEEKLTPVRRLLGKQGDASAWNGKLVARLLAQDGFALRKSLVPVLGLLAGGVDLPGVWLS